jgi:RNA polymerase sigma-70 factor (ECF subfamily)
LNIIQSIKYGDEFVFQQVFYEYHERLYFYFLGKTKSTYLAEETVQITFIKFWNYRESLNEELSVYTQLFRIASTTLIDLLRKKYTASTLVRELLKLETEPSANVVEHNIDASDTERMLYKVLQSMPPMRRKVFELSRFEGKSYNEISSELSISPKTVENHIALAI